MNDLHVLADTLAQRALDKNPLGPAEMLAFSITLRRVAFEYDKMKVQSDELAETERATIQARRGGRVVSLPLGLVLLEGDR